MSLVGMFFLTRIFLISFISSWISYYLLFYTNFSRYCFSA